MSAADNKRALQVAFESLAKGDGKPFVDLWADGFTRKKRKEYRLQP